MTPSRFAAFTAGELRILWEAVAADKENENGWRDDRHSGLAREIAWEAHGRGFSLPGEGDGMRAA